MSAASSSTSEPTCDDLRAAITACAARLGDDDTYGKHLSTWLSGLVDGERPTKPPRVYKEGPLLKARQDARNAALRLCEALHSGWKTANEQRMVERRAGGEAGVAAQG